MQKGADSFPFQNYSLIRFSLRLTRGIAFLITVFVEDTWCSHVEDDCTIEKHVSDSAVGKNGGG
jgi:hypothetical protein